MIDNDKRQNEHQYAKTKNIHKCQEVRWNTFSMYASHLKKDLFLVAEDRWRAEIFLRKTPKFIPLLMASFEPNEHQFDRILVPLKHGAFAIVTAHRSKRKSLLL